MERLDVDQAVIQKNAGSSCPARPATMLRKKRAGRGSEKVSLNDEIAHLRGLDQKGLRARWQSVFKQQAPVHLPRHLQFGILAYRIQADQLGDLDAAIARMLKQIGEGGVKIEVARMASDFDRKQTELRVGTLLTREWNGNSERVMVLDDKFAWDGKTFDSLSKVAFAITGTRWNGPRFFGLRDKKMPEVSG